jgi:two-component system sensor histidine kinase HydH
MDTIQKTNRFQTIVPPWILIGAAVILLPLFTLMTIANIHRHREASIKLLIEKGAALIRSFEAGTRTGLMGEHFNGKHLQQLLTETAMQKDIIYLTVVNTNGITLAHNNLSKIGYPYGSELNLFNLSHAAEINWRIIEKPGEKTVFEVFRRFSPSGRQWQEPNALRLFRQLCRPYMADWKSINPSDLVIFIGLDLSSLEEAGRNDMRQAIIIAGVMLLIGLTGIILLFLMHNFRATKVSLSRIEAFSDNLVENMPIGLIVIDNHKQLTSFNQVAETFFGHLTEGSIGKDVAEIIPRELWELIEDPDIRNGIVEKEIICPVKDGRMISFEVSSTLLHDRDNNFLGYILLFKDLTEIQSLKKNLARSQRLASVGRLAAGVAHEIRNPLSSIKGFATYFKERYEKQPEDKQTAEIMIQEVDRLNRVVSQLLEFAIPVSVNGNPIDMKKLINDSLKLIEQQVQEKNIQVTINQIHELGEIFLDSDKINQILLNLYLNALDAMEKGGSLVIAFGKDPWKRGIEISVTDTGTGIDKKDLPNIFDPYFTKKPDGTGIGLAIVHNIVEAHNGEIKIESQVGKGTTFTVFLSELSRPCDM